MTAADLVSRARDLAHRAHAGQVDKRCSGCKETLSLGNFNRCANGRFGLHNHCRSCQAIAKRRYYLANREKELAKSAARARDEKVRSARRERYATDHQYRERQLAANRDRRRTPAARQKANAARLRLMERSATAKLAIYMRVRVRKAIKGIARSGDTMSMIGCTAEQLKQHLEDQFKPGMTWGNYSYRGWHVDHIRPCASFDLTDPLQQSICFHYTNLRPEWRHANQSKGAKVADNADEGRLALLEPATAARLRRKYAKARAALGVAS